MKLRLFTMLAVMSLLSACSGGSSTSNPTPTTPSSPATPTTPTTPATTTFKGTIAGSDGSSGQSGTLSITIQAAIGTSSVSSIQSGTRTVGPLSVSEVSSTLRLVSGSTFSLTGTFDSSTNKVSLSGSGYTVTDTIGAGNSVLSGTYTGPSGSKGGSSALNSTQNSVTAYCGTFQGHGSGVFNIAISAAGAVSGTTSPSDAGDQACVLTGQLAGRTLTLSCPGSQNGSATGTVQNGAVSGTVASGATFSGSVCQ